MSERTIWKVLHGLGWWCNIYMHGEQIYLYFVPTVLSGDSMSCNTQFFLLDYTINGICKLSNTPPPHLLPAEKYEIQLYGCQNIVLNSIIDIAKNCTQSTQPDLSFHHQSLCLTTCIDGISKCHSEIVHHRHQTLSQKRPPFSPPTAYFLFIHFQRNFVLFIFLQSPCIVFFTIERPLGILKEKRKIKNDSTT